MTQEDKELLLRDLCGRLPYGVTVRVSGEWFYDKEEAHDFKLSVQNDRKLARFMRDECEIKPYLRPMSSMTEKEKKDYMSMEAWKCFDWEMVDWYNKHHLDYRGMIRKGLALEAKEGMYEID